MKLSVHLVTWNGAKYVPFLFASLRNQTFRDWKLVIFDNASTDGTVEKIKEEIRSFPVEVEFLENRENLGFAGGHNKLFQKTDAEYFLCLNQDMVLDQTCFEKMVQFLDSHSDAAVVSPRLMKWNFEEKIFTDQIDTLGLKVFRSRRVVEKESGQLWSEVKNTIQAQSSVLEVFGVSGALPCFRLSSAKKIAFEGKYFFDESYHSYKEDVDVAFRLRSCGYSAYTLLDAVAFHDRSAAGPAQMTDTSAVKNKKTQSDFVKFHSYKNHLMNLYKNEYCQNFFLDFFQISWYELKKFVFYFLFDRKVLSGLFEVSKNCKDLKQKRNFIVAARSVSSREIRKWWN